MRHIIRRDPLDLSSMSRLFQSMFSDPFFAAVPTPAGAGGVEEGNLALDVSEDERTVIVRASLPGFRKENIDIEVHDGVLTIKAEHAEEHEERGETYYRRERRAGAVSRRVALPSPVLESDTKAELSDGVLTLRIPKSSKATPNKIKIS